MEPWRFDLLQARRLTPPEIVLISALPNPSESSCSSAIGRCSSHRAGNLLLRHQKDSALIVVSTGNSYCEPVFSSVSRSIMIRSRGWSVASALASNCSWLSLLWSAGSTAALLSSDSSRELAGVFFFANDRWSAARRSFLASLPARKSVELTVRRAATS
jgi:hypothetical protein